MGCCESCFGKQNDEPNERTNLLNPQGIVPPLNSSDPVAAEFDQQDSTPVGSVPHSKQDEQSILTGIIQQYNADVIDITSLDSKIDAVEYMNRVQVYNRKVASLAGTVRFKIQPLFSSGNDPVSVLASPPIDDADIALITQISDELTSAFSSVKVTRNKDLVLSLSHR